MSPQCDFRASVIFTRNDLTLSFLTENQIRGPFGTGTGSAFSSSTFCHHNFNRIQTGVEHLRSQLSHSAAPDREHRGAMHQRPDREHEPRVLAGSSSQSQRQTFAQQIERWPRFVQGRRLGEVVIQDLVGVAMLEGKFEVSLASLRHGAGVAKGGEKLGAGLQT